MFYDESDKFADELANCSYKHYQSCVSRKGKPRNNREWTLLASVIMALDLPDGSMKLKVVAMGTGTKCIGQSKMSKEGEILNDSHAEIISRRAFLRFLYQEIGSAYSKEGSDIFHLQSLQEGNLCVLKPGISFHFFMSHTPCGDASIFPKMTTEMSDCIGDECSSTNTRQPESEQKEIEPPLPKDSGEPLPKQAKIDAVQIHPEHSASKLKLKVISSENAKMREETIREKCKTVPSNPPLIEDIFRTGAKCVPEGEQDEHAPGIRYHCVGVLRIKPGRGCCTLSLSCSDKMARWNILGCEGALLNHFLLKPIYFDSFILGRCPYSQEAMYRALMGRLQKKSEHLNLPENYHVHKPMIIQSSLEFPDGRDSQNSFNENSKNEKLDPCNTSIIWYMIGKKSFEEVAVNGRKQGVTQKNSHKPSSRLTICSKELFAEFKRILEISTKFNRVPQSLKEFSNKGSQCTYHTYKMAAKDYQKAWSELRREPLKTWIQKSRGLIQFTLE